MLALLRPLLSSPSFLPNAQNADGDTLLITAARSCHPSVVALLLTHPSLSLDLPNHTGWTALHLAARHPCPPMVTALIAAGADPEGIRGAVRGEGERRLLIRAEDRRAVREAMEEGVRLYEQRLRALLNTPGVTGDAFLPHELQRIVVNYCIGKTGGGEGRRVESRQ